MTDTSALRAFIEARLAEDERGALINGTQPAHWRAITDGNFGPAVRTGTDDAPEWSREVNYQMWRCDDEEDGCPEIARHWIAEAEHIARHDPARVLREVAVNRAILGELDAAFRAAKAHPDDLANAGRLLTMVRVLKLLASAWQDHPDYRTEWAPQ